MRKLTSPALFSNITLNWKCLRDKHSSLLRTFLDYGHKRFYNIGTRATVVAVVVVVGFNDDTNVDASVDNNRPIDSVDRYDVFDNVD